jgi:hypothetical protein
LTFRVRVKEAWTPQFASIIGDVIPFATTTDRARKSNSTHYLDAVDEGRSPGVVQFNKVLVVLYFWSNPRASFTESTTAFVKDDLGGCTKLQLEIEALTSSNKTIVQANVIVRPSADIFLITGSNLPRIKIMLAARLKKTRASSERLREIDIETCPS